MKTTSDIEHWKKKRADEEAAIKEAQQVADTTEAELVVRVYHFVRVLLLN